MMNKHVALLEILISLGLIRNTAISDDKTSRVVSSLATVYLLYGAYLNMNGQVKMLEAKDERTKNPSIFLKK